MYNQHQAALLDLQQKNLHTQIDLKALSQPADQVCQTPHTMPFAACLHSERSIAHQSRPGPGPALQVFSLLLNNYPAAAITPPLPPPLPLLLLLEYLANQGRQLYDSFCSCNLHSSLHRQSSRGSLQIVKECARSIVPALRMPEATQQSCQRCACQW